MNLIGEKVIRKDKSKGVVKSIEDSRIEIVFGEGENASFVKFQYPMCFSKQFLKFEREELNQFINEVVKSYACFYCGNENEQTANVDGKRVCRSCKKKNTFSCNLCGGSHLEDNSLFLNVSTSFYKKVKICKDCSDEKTFVCDNCEKRLANSEKSKVRISGKTLCKRCKTEIIKECTFCNSLFDIDKGDYFYGYRNPIYVCPDCVEEQTFVCSKCESRELNTYRANSKFVPADRMICRSCVTTCSLCKADIDKEHTNEAFGKKYCPDCWNRYMKTCSICEDEFVDDSLQKEICPDCEEMEGYLERIQNKDFSNRKYIEMSAYSLEHMDRCKLFTSLFENCNNLDGGYFLREHKEPFHFIVMRMFGLDAVVTWLPKDLIGKVKCSENFTMTEFRKKHGIFKSFETIKYWLSKTNHYITIPAGRMRVLCYPIKLRVQTEYDKIYGKEWNGPDDYIEIGNYGDTTNFYIIGVLEKE